MNVYDVIKRPLITEKGHAKREAERTLAFEVHPGANKIQIKQAVETDIQGESRGRPDQRACRKIAPPRQIHRICLGLEKGVCAPGSRLQSA